MSVLGIDQVQDQLAHVQGAGRLRPASAQQAPGDRDPRLGTRERRASDSARQAGFAPADLHRVAAVRGGGPVRLPPAPAGRGVGVRVHLDPDFKEAYHVLFKERRLGVDVLDSIVVIGCLGTMAIFPGRCCAGASASAVSW